MGKALFFLSGRCPELMKEMIETEEVNTSEIEPGQAIDAGSGE